MTRSVWRASTDTIWHNTGLLLKSSSHPLMARLIQKYDTSPCTGADQRYGLTHMLSWGDTRTILYPSPCDTEIDPKTAASHALIYACWNLDLELAIAITKDLHTIIDVNILVNNRSIIELVMISGWQDYNEERMDLAINICRLVIIYFGSKLDAGCLCNTLHRTCSQFEYADVVMYLIALYDSEIDHASRADGIFRCLVRGGWDEEACKYLALHQDQIQNRVESAIIPAAQSGTTSMFRHVLTVFLASTTTEDVRKAFRALCCAIDFNKALRGVVDTRDWDDKIVIVRELWPHLLTPKIIKEGLGDNWRWAVTIKERLGIVETLKHIAQVVIRTFMDLIQGRGIAVALALCCCAHNLELLDEIIDRNLEQIQARPKLTRHAVVECAAHRDIDAFGHMLIKLQSCMAPDTLKIWCDVYDLEAVRMILEIGMSEAMAKSIPVVLKATCRRGDAELVEMLVQYAGDSIKRAKYSSALREACLYDREDVIRVIAANCYDYFSFRAMSKERISYKIMYLLYSLFGTHRSYWQLEGNQS